MCKTREWDNLRSSIDTLYVGFRCDIETGQNIVEEIKNYLSSLCFISLNEGKGNAYYWGSYYNKDRGVIMYVEPRKNLLNDFITLQLSGKFFHDIWDSRNFLIMLFDKYADYLIFQRIDVAVDVMFIDFPVSSPKDGFLSGFPIPSYNEDYNYTKQGFEVYGRCSSNPQIMYFHNMVAQGKSDVRLRVYDKSLDNYEKEHCNYSDVYMLETEYSQVYRIEFQARGQYLKGFMDKYIGEYGEIEYHHIIEAFICYFFHKYKFEGVEMEDIITEFRKPLSFSRTKKESSLEAQFEHHKAIQNKAYFKCCEISDKLQAHRQVAKALGMSKEIIDNVIGDFDLYACAREFAEINERLINDR